MQLLSALASGFPDAPNGSAVIYRRGTSTRATCFTDFNGNVSTRTHTLDSKGRLARWVNEIVDINIFDANGASIISFTDGGGAPALEVRHAHWTGVDYDTGQSSLGKPLTLQTLLDTLFTSFGADDGKVLLAGAQVALQTAIGSLSLSNIIDVKTQNGALGNGLQDDTARIQAAIATCAAAANGGTVYLPPGDFRITSNLDFSISGGEKVALMGAGPGLTFLAMDHPTNNWINVGNSGPATGFQTIAGIRFRAIQANSGFNLSDAAGNWKRYRMVNCHFGETSGSHVRMQTAGHLLFEDCIFTLAGGANNNAIHAVNTTGNGPVIVRNCHLIGPAGSFTPTNAILFCSKLQVEGGRFDFSGVNGGSGFLIDTRATTGSQVRGVRFNVGTAGWTCMNPGSFGSNTTDFVEEGNSFEGSEALFTGWSTSLGRYHLGSRMGRWEAQNVSGTPMNASPNMTAFAKFQVIANTPATTLNIAPALADAPSGALWFCEITNLSGGATTVVFDANFKAAAAVSPANNQVVMYCFFKQSTKWYQVGTAIAVAV